MKKATTGKAALRAWRRLAVMCLGTAAALAVSVVLPGLAFADAANPEPTTTGTATHNADGSVTVQLNGTWSWPGQHCGSRYGVGWAVDWWGVSSTKAPSPRFVLTDAGEVLPAGPLSKPWSLTALGTGSVEPLAAIAIPRKPGTPPPPPGSSGPYFHVGLYYAGEDTNLCAQTMSDGTPYGPWSATATYPSAYEIPAQLCVNMYDEHGTAGKSSGNPKDFSPSKDDDNSIQTNDFDPTSGGHNCTASSTLTEVGEEGGGPG